MESDWKYKKALQMLEAERNYGETETLYGGRWQKVLVEFPRGVKLYVHQKTLDFLEEHHGIALVNVRCAECAHKREENGVLRCQYSTVDLDPNGYCHRGVIGNNEKRSD